MDIELTAKDGKYTSVDTPAPAGRRHSGGRCTGSRWRTVAVVLFGVLVVVLLITIAVLSSRHGTHRGDGNGNGNGAGASSGSVWDPNHTTGLSLDDCLAANVQDGLNTMVGRGYQRLSTTAPESVLLQHAHLVSAGTEVDDVDILLTGTSIAAVSASGERLSAPGAQTIDVEGRFVTPALVDMHSHLGVYSFPELWATQDGNEMTNPTFPQVRARDGFDPYDYAIPEVLSGGIVTVQVLPGSGNTMGGMGFHAKLRGHSVESMLIPDSPNVLKMACGENPKRVYGSRDQTPMSRMGNLWVMRQKLSEARSLMERQDAWCSSSSPAHKFPNDISVQPLVRLLRNSTSTRVNIHCYKVLDLEAMVSLSKEFAFNISAFHHALEAWRIPGLLKEHGITAATFADLGLYKYEAYDASVRGPRILDEAGVNTVLKTDHPVTFAKRLMFDAAKSYYYGLNRMTAYSSVTLNPAKSIGLSHRVGSIEPGKDADVVVWSKDPLVLGATPTHVFANGELVVDNPIPLSPSESSTTPPAATLAPSGPTACSDGLSAKYAVTGVSMYTPDGVKHAGWNVVVQDGMIQCAGEPATCAPAADSDVYDLEGGTLIPGLIESLSNIGQVEIDSEWTTQDGELDVTVAADLAAVDGIRLHTRHVRSTYRAGVTATVSQPMGTDLILGQSVSFFTLPPSDSATVFTPGVMVKPTVALHATIGNLAKNSGWTKSVSGQLALLRRTLSGNGTTPSQAPVLASVVKGYTPLVVHVNQLDAIAAVVHVKADFPNLNLVIAEAAEAHLMAAELAAAGVSVVLRSRPMAKDFDTLRSSDCALAVLTAAGVNTALAIGDLDNARNLRWEAGYGVECGLSEFEALSAVTTKVADVFGLDGKLASVAAGSPANFVALDGPALTTLGRPQVVAVGQRVVCTPLQR